MAKSRGRPATKVKSNPTLGQIIQWAQSDVSNWEIRDQRMKEDQLLYELTRPGKNSIEEGKEVVILNDPMVIVDYLAGMVCDAQWTLTARPRVGATKQYAQDLKNALVYWDEQIDLDWESSGHYSASYEQAQHVFLRGMICERVSIIPKYSESASAERGATDYDCPYPWDYFIADPANIYPRWSGKSLIRVTHRQWLTAAEILDDESYPDSKTDDFDDDNPNNVEEVLSQYYFGKLWDFHAIVTKSGKWLKKPTAIGYMPWVITKSSGAAYRATKDDSSMNWQKFESKGILTAMKDQMKDLNKATSMFQTMLAAEANPSIAYFGEDPTVMNQIDMRAGAKFAVRQNDKVQTMVTGPNLDHFKSQVDSFERRIGNATLPPAAYGNGKGDSALVNTQMAESALNIIKPYIRALAHAKQSRYNKALELFCEHFPSDTPLFAPTKRTTEDPVGSWTHLTADQIDTQGYHLTVDYDTKTLQERLAIGNAVTALTNAKVISMETGRGPRWLAEPDPLEESEKVITESMYQNPEVMKMLAPIMASRTGEELLARINQMVSAGKPGDPNQGNPAGTPPEPQPQIGMPGMVGQMPPGAPPGMGMMMPPMPAPTMGGGMIPGGMGAPPTPPGLPLPSPSMMPPGMMGPGFATAPPDLVTLLKMMASRAGGSPFGGAGGGGGMGGTPPPPPMMNQPGLPPPPF